MQSFKEIVKYARRGIYAVIANSIVIATLIYMVLSPTWGQLALLMSITFPVSICGALLASLKNYQKYMLPIRHIQDTLKTSEGSVLNLNFNED